jgi:hypothetical protein
MTSIVGAAIGGACIAGMLCLGLALVRTWLNWRSDVPTSKFWTSGSDLAVHPERYVPPHTAVVVRTWSMAGMTLIVVGVLGVVGVALARWLS